jgi:hypothetical protein
VAWPSVAGVVPATYHDVNQILMDVIREARPRQLHVASLSPLIGSQEQAGLLLHAATRWS